MIALLLGLCLAVSAFPETGAAPWSVGLLLVGGAAIGVPHGGSDFLVAHRTLRPRFGAAWLPVFLCVYLAVVGLVLAGWAYRPVPTLVLFLGVSALHFGARDGLARRPLVRLAAAATPVLPIFMFHPAEVGPVLAAMTGGSDHAAVAALLGLREVAIWPWLATIAAAGLSVVLDRRSTPGALLDVAELAALSLAAWLLPPFLTFGIYFCLLHSVRHMAHLTAQAHPREPARALALAATIILPSAALCGLGLFLFWDALAGTVRTPDLLCRALQVLAALTVPHMILETLSERGRDTAPDAAWRVRPTRQSFFASGPRT